MKVLSLGIAGILSSLALLTNSPAKAVIIYESSPLQTFEVDSRSNVFPIGQSKAFSSSLDAGTWYKFVATGEWTPDYRLGPSTLEQLQADPTLLSLVPWRVDAKFVTENLWTTNSDIDPKGYGDFGLYSSLLGGGNDDFWGTFNVAHAYEYELLGSGQPADFYVQDINFEDNFGSYKIQLYRAADVSTSSSVPGPLPVLGAAAAFGFSRKLRMRIKSSEID
jgi:hypothetical protein